MAIETRKRIVGGTERQKEDYRFFEERLPALLADKMLAGKFVVISNHKEQGFYDTFENALNEALLRFEFGDFIIQEVANAESIIITRLLIGF